MQPYWLINRNLKNNYKLVLILSYGLSYGLIFGLIIGLTVGLLFGLMGGLLFGLMEEENESIKTVENIKLNFEKVSSFDLLFRLYLGLFVGVNFGLIFGLMGVKHILSLCCPHGSISFNHQPPQSIDILTING